jgi:hypothetical protein
MSGLESKGQAERAHEKMCFSLSGERNMEHASIEDGNLMPAAKAAPKPRARLTEAEADDAVSLQQILEILDGLSVGELRQIANAAEAK